MRISEFIDIFLLLNGFELFHLLSLCTKSPPVEEAMASIVLELPTGSLWILPLYYLLGTLWTWQPKASCKVYLTVSGRSMGTGMVCK